MSSPTAFVTGIAGFGGSHLAEELLNHDFSVSGSILKGESTANISKLKSSLQLVDLDVLDPKNLVKTLGKLAPDYIFHLAAVASVGKSFEMENMTYQVNFDGTLNLLQAAKELPKIRKLLFISSSEVYGAFKPAGKTLNEEQPFNPISPYGVSKVAGEYVCQSYAHRFRMPVTIARSFNHSGPRQARDFVIPSFACQIAAIEAGRQDPILKAGDLTVKRDISDVRDIVRGYRLAAQKGKDGRVYQFCSGKAVSIQRILEMLLGFSTVKISVQTDQKRIRKADIPQLRGTFERARKELGWSPEYDLKATLLDTLNYCRAQMVSR